MKFILPISWLMLWNEVYTSYLLSNVMKWSLYFLFVVECYEMKLILPICCLMLWNEVYAFYLLSYVMKWSLYSYLLSNDMKWCLYFLFVV